MKLSIIIPAYNEMRTIAELVRRVEAVPLDKELILVDNVSTDGTREWIRDYPGPARKILHERNLGKGGSVKDGLAAATGDAAIIQDADLEYDPAEIPRLFAPVERGEADVVFGSRYLLGQGHNQLFDWGGKSLNCVTNLLFGGNLTDVATCYKLMSRHVYQQLRFVANGFDLDFEIAARLLGGGYRVVELPISYARRSRAEGKKIRMSDGWRALRTLWRVRTGR